MRTIPNSKNQNSKSERNGSLSAEEFFARKNTFNLEDTAGFKESLRQNVLEHYNIFQNTQNMDSLKKPLFSGLTLLFTIIGVFLITGITSFFFFVQNQSENTGLSATIALYEGDIEILNTDGGWNDLAESATVMQGDTIRVADAGRAVINLDDGSSVRLNSNSEVTFTSLDPQNIVINNNGGEIYTRVVKSDRTFQVVSDDTTYTSLGTAYKTINTEEKEGVVVYESAVKVEKDGEELITVEEGKEFDLKTSEVKDINADALVADEFVKWNAEQDKKEFSDQLGILDKVVVAEVDQPKEEVNEQIEEVIENVPADSIVLSGVQSVNGITLNWTISGIEVNDGYKVLKSYFENPVFGVDASQYISDPAVTTYSENIIDGKTYNFRVCRYLPDVGCDAYSNNVAIAAPLIEPVVDPAPVQSSGTLSLTGLSPKEKGFQVSWSNSGVSADQGYKINYSTNANPVYQAAGTNSDYVGKESATSHTKKGLSAGTYYVNVCRYTGDGCDTYSNTLSVVVEGAQASVVNSISLSANGKQVTWSIDGKAVDGVKVVWAKDVTPEYPTHNAYYRSETNAGDAWLDAYDGSGIYNVRVCEYLPATSTCGVYSNMVQVEL